jgi:hypothetical protein
MILILISWIILAFFFLTAGVFLQSILGIKRKTIPITLFLGICTQCFVLNVFSLFIRIGIEVFIINLALSLLLFYYQRKVIYQYWDETKLSFNSLSLFSKSTLLVLLLLSLLKCAQSPILADNESYYIQTIKWINEYGFMKGLANLHIFFAQTSPFHVLQAGFNFNFISNRINDLNGFILIISSFFYLTIFEKRMNEKKETHWIGLITLFNVLFFQFINSPSPDFILLVLSQIVFYLFLEEKKSDENFKIITLLILLLIFIKITIAPFILIPLYLLVREKKGLLFFISAGTITTLLFIIKNSITSGYPFYPLNLFPLPVDWKVPETILVFITEATNNTGYFENLKLNQPSYLNKINSWLHLGGINRIFNWGILLLFVLALFTKKIQKQNNYKILYLILAIHFIIILSISPQFRFFLPEFIFLTALFISDFCERIQINQKMICYLLLYLSILPIVAIELVNFKYFTENKLHQRKASLNWTQIFIPSENSSLSKIPFEKRKRRNMEYYSPKENFFFWGTTNGPLPCVNKVQLDYFEKYYHIIPQLRTTSLKDGFYSKRIISKNHKTK